MANDGTLIQIRERSFLDLLDLALVVIRRRPLPLGLAALAGVLPCVALNAWLFGDSGWADSEGLGFFGYLVVLSMEVPWATAPLTIVLGGLMFGERPTAGRVLSVLLRALPAMFIYQVVIRGILTITGVLYLVIPAQLGFIDEVVLLERGPFGGVMKRTTTLTKQRSGDFIGQWVAQMLFAVLFILCFMIGTEMMFSSLTTSELTWDTPALSELFDVRCQVAIWLAVSFFGVTRFLTYIDQRIRLEGWEVKLRLQAVGRALEEAASW